jgi:hypothetical protein
MANKAPELCVYGDILEITRNTDQGEGNDNAVRPGKKTD